MPVTANNMNFNFFNDAFLYDPTTGIITNKFSRRNAKEGSESGGARPDGYRQVCLEGELYLAHRVAYLLHHREIDPALQIDHINHVRNDNRIVNLRLVTHRVNLSYLQGDYPLGVYLNKQSGKLKAQIQINGTNKYLGCFNDVDKAAQAYQDALALVE